MNPDQEIRSLNHPPYFKLKIKKINMYKNDHDASCRLVKYGNNLSMINYIFIIFSFIRNWFKINAFLKSKF